MPLSRKPQTLKAYRRAHGLSQREAGRLIKVSQPTWFKLEHGTTPRLVVAKRLARVTGISIDRLLKLPRRRAS